MTNDTENLMLEHLRAMRAEMARTNTRLDTLQAEMTAVRHHISGMAALQDHDHADIADIKIRLDRAEARLGLVDEAS